MAEVSQSQGAQSAEESHREGRLVAWLGIAGFALLGIAAAFMWAGFGSTIFVDMLTFVRSCF